MTGTWSFCTRPWCDGDDIISVFNDRPASCIDILGKNLVVSVLFELWIDDADADAEDGLIVLRLIVFFCNDFIDTYTSI